MSDCTEARATGIRPHEKCCTVQIYVGVIVVSVFFEAVVGGFVVCYIVVAVADAAFRKRTNTKNHFQDLQGMVDGHRSSRVLQSQSYMGCHRHQDNFDIHQRHAAQEDIKNDIRFSQWR